MNKRILLIDDDADIRQLVQIILEQAGYEMLEAASGPAGLRQAQSEAIDLVLLDVMMPGINGWEVLERLKGDPQTASIPVVLFTVRNQQLDSDKACLHLADGYLHKPFVAQELLEMVTKQLTVMAK
jgi:CheY-like chemotaxis protein